MYYIVPYCLVADNFMSYPVRWGAMSYPDMQYRTRTRNVVPGGAMSYTEVQCRNRTCNVVPGVAMLYQEVQCRTRTCNVVPGHAMSYPDIQYRTRTCNVVPGGAISYPGGDFPPGVRRGWACKATAVWPKDAVEYSIKSPASRSRHIPFWDTVYTKSYSDLQNASLKDFLKNWNNNK